MTPEMIDLAQRNAEKRKAAGASANVEFHLATIDALPLADASVDCVISNCVINLAPDKPAVFREIARVLKPGGRLAVSDIALKQPLPAELGDDIMAYVGCIAGAIPIEDYKQGLVAAGFSNVEVVDSGSDLNVYAKIENQSGCCAPAVAETSTPVTAISATSSRNLPLADARCCGPQTASSDVSLREALADLLNRYNVNDYAASVKVYAVK
jgi:SAM-dependent methyltransferase